MGQASASGAIGMVTEIFGPLSGLLAAAGVVGLAIALTKMMLASGDGGRESEAAGYAARVFGLCVVMGSFGAIASWLFSMFSDGAGSATSVISSIAGQF